MTNFIIIFISFFAGFFLKYSKKFPQTSSQTINQFVIYISMPSLIFAKFPSLLKTLDLNGNWWVAVSMPWLNFILAWAFIYFVGQKLNWTKAKTGALILTCGLGNTSFVGFPILEALLGKEAIPFGILCDQPGSFLIVSSLGILVASMFSGEKIIVSNMLKRLLTFPPFLSLVLSSLWFLLGTPGEALAHDAFEKISLSLVPLSLFAVGFQTHFKWSVIKRRKIPLMIGIPFKLILMPIIFYFLYFKVLGQTGLISVVTILESAMATMITASVVAMEFNLDTELANLMVGLSIPLSVITVPLFNYMFFTH
jgi:predicted permease